MYFDVLQAEPQKKKAHGETYHEFYERNDFELTPSAFDVVYECSKKLLVLMNCDIRRFTVCTSGPL